jgi:hypothetical protein
MTKSSQRPDYGVDVTASVAFSTSAQARAAVKALIPDNVNMPEGLTIRIFSRGRAVFVKLAAKGVPAGTIANTMDEVLAHISVARKAMGRSG